jgi:glucuronate isomerase
MEYVPFATGDAKAAFDKRMAGGELTKEEIDSFKTAVLMACAEEYVKYDWAMQVHIGALRNNSRKLFEKLGPDTGFDSINDLCIAEALGAFMSHLEYADCLPKTILYTLNPKDNYVLGTMMGCFQNGGIKGKIQFGSGWWFNDQRDGMLEQMKSLANLGVLGNFVGMLTDSRSFVSYTRHEYFRRILCNLIGNWVDNGEYPYDEEILGDIIRGISYENAVSYFKFDGVTL